MYDLVFYNKKFNNEICRLSFNETGEVVSKQGDDSWLDYTYEPYFNGQKINFETQPLRWGEGMVAAYASNEHVRAEKEASTLNAPPEPLSPDQTAVAVQKEPMKTGTAILSTLLTHVVASIVSGIVFFILALVGLTSLFASNGNNSILAISATAWLVLFLLFVPAMLAFAVWLEIKFVAKFAKRVLPLGTSVIAMVILPLACYVIASVLAVIFAPLAILGPILAILAGAMFVQKRAVVAITN